MNKEKMIAMLLAGGQGTRLKELTEKNAKPAVHFGGKYRIIDFALSNCANSGIRNVGILTQYQPLALSMHIGIGGPWDLDRQVGGVEVLPPHMTTQGGQWYAGTSNAIYENLDYIDMRDPEFVLILSGDHIYKMDYSKMLDFHIEKNAAVTISAIQVLLDEASRFGILNTLEDGRIYEFEEKPENPKNDLASMGVYIFNWDILREWLIKDQKNPKSSHDFGKDILPGMLEEGFNLYAYSFSGYWRDVGTVESYWQANMDLLDPENSLNLFDEDWRIFTNNYNVPAQYISPSSKVERALINEGCIVHGQVKNSILSTSAVVKKGAQIEGTILLPGAIVGENAVLKNVIVLSHETVEDGVVITSDEITIYGAEDYGMVINRREL
ncbi:MAG: glucose-1-phosphate adenylyltransferase [Tissierellia bacterium]|nr:glucose-1-phosphate adenylyltransferase [Tissierellia bacterium]